MKTIQTSARRELARLPRILCVDDDVAVLAEMSRVMAGRYDVVLATCANDGMRLLAERGPFAAIICAFTMPEIDGAELLARVRLVSPATVRVLLTGSATRNDVVAAVNRGGVFRVLIKPCGNAELLAAIADSVEQHRLLTTDRALVEQKVAATSAHIVRTERLASLGTMAAAVGHELNNLLTTFQSALYFVDGAVASGTTPMASDVELLKGVQEKLALHARNLLNLGRPAASTEEVTELLRGIHATVETLQLAGLLSDVQLVLELPHQSLPVRIGAIELDQILLNLIKNAVEAHAERSLPRPFIRITVEGDAARELVRCSVSDNAGGIPADRLPLLFEPYFTTKPADRGTGLGLFVVRQLARNAGGDVHVESQVGVGTTFTIDLARAEAAAASEQTAA